MKNKERTFFEMIKRLLEPTKENPWLYIRGIVKDSLRIINPIIHILFIERLVYYIEEGNLENFNNIIFLYLLYGIFFEFISFLMRKWGRIELIEGLKNTVQRKYINKFLKLDNTYSERIGTGKFIALVEKGIHTWGMLMVLLTESLFGIIAAFLFTLYMIGRVNISYAFLFVLLYIVVQIIGIYLNSFMIKYRNMRIESDALHTKQLVKIIMSKFEVLQTGKSEREIDILDRYNNEMIYYNIKMANYLHFFNRIPKGMVSWSKILILSILGINIIESGGNLSILVGIFGVMTLMEKAIEDGIKFYKDFTKQVNYVTKMWDLFDNTPEIKGYDKGKKFKHSKGEIEIKSLTYGYIKKNPVFKDFSLKIKGEKVTALVGNSGSGKTTLVKLIAGYIRSDNGDIIVDGQTLKSISLKSYYKDIGYLTQEPSVFDGTVLDNLTYAIDRELKQGELENIIKKAKCEFIYDFPNGINTEIGEKGIRLSGGQRQRLAIAKIFLKDPKIILLDEPTSALDSFSEELITKAMHNLFKGRTIIVIAHRLQTVKNADDIILIENGKIKERGTHKELVKQKGIYKKMLDLQSGF